MDPASSAITIGYEVVGIVVGCTIVIGLIGGWVVKQSVDIATLRGEQKALRKEHDNLAERYASDEVSRREARQSVYSQIAKVDSHVTDMKADVSYLRGVFDGQQREKETSQQ